MTEVVWTFTHQSPGASLSALPLLHMPPYSQDTLYKPLLLYYPLQISSCWRCSSNSNNPIWRTPPPLLVMRVRLRLLHPLHVVLILYMFSTMVLLSTWPLMLLIFTTSVHHLLSPMFALLMTHFFLFTILAISIQVHFSSPLSHVSRLSMNLMSIIQIIDYNYQVIFYRTSRRVLDRSGTVIGAGRRHSGVYALDSLCLPSPATPIHHCHTVVLFHHMWHHRLGHLCPRMASLVHHGV